MSGNSDAGAPPAEPARTGASRQREAQVFESARGAIAQHGYVLLPRAFDARACAALAAGFSRPMPRAGGVRDVLHGVLGAHPALRVLNDIARTLAGAPARAVRAALFDKSSASNWLVAWHQDLSIAVRTREELAGFRNWSLKQGVWHVQPPWTVLENMLTLRLHLDDCGVDNGPLQVLPGSHQWGRLDEPRIAAFLMAGEPVTCSARAGDVLALRPGLLHASGKAKTPSRRRVLHVEYATQELPRPLCWRDPPPDPSG